MLSAEILDPNQDALYIMECKICLEKFFEGLISRKL